MKYIISGEEIEKDECAYILEGEGLVTIGGRTTAIGPGDFVGYPAGGEPHTMRNRGDVGDYPNLKKRVFRNKGQEWNLVDFDNVEYPQAGKK